MKDRIEFLVKEIESIRHNLVEVDKLPQNKRTRKFKTSCKEELTNSITALGRLVDEDVISPNDAYDSGLEYLEVVSNG